MIKTEDIISEHLITLDLKANSKKSAIAELAWMLFCAGKLRYFTGFIDSVNERENALSTYCGSGIAIPHAKSLFVKEASFAFGRTCGFPWEKKEGNVNFIFLLAIPEVLSGNPSESDHIYLLSSIAELALEKNIRDKWAAAKTKRDIIETFTSILTDK